MSSAEREGLVRSSRELGAARESRERDSLADEVRLADLIRNHAARLTVVGQGYVGLPLAVAFARTGFTVTGLDTDPERVAARACSSADPRGRNRASADGLEGDESALPPIDRDVRQSDGRPSDLEHVLQPEG